MERRDVLRPSVLTTQMKTLEPDLVVTDNNDNMNISDVKSQVHIRLSQVPEGSLPSNFSSNLSADQTFIVKNESQLKHMKHIQPLLIPKIETSSSVQGFGAGVKKVKTRRDEARRANHNEIERRRRDKINTWILELGKIIPENIYSDLNGSNSNSSSSSNSKPPTESLSKGGVLAKACEYITRLKTLNSELHTELNSMSQGSDNKQLEEIERLSRYNERLLLENAQLKRKMDELEFADGDFGDEISRKQFREGDAENGSS